GPQTQLLATGSFCVLSSAPVRIVNNRQQMVGRKLAEKSRTRQKTMMRVQREEREPEKEIANCYPLRPSLSDSSVNGCGNPLAAPDRPGIDGPRHASAD